MDNCQDGHQPGRDCAGTIYPQKFFMNRKIKKIIRQVLQPLDYQSIYLFGSRARGDFSEKSDYDLLVILKDSLTVAEKMRFSAQARREFAKRGIDADVIIKSSEEMETSKARIGSVVREALREGVAL